MRTTISVPATGPCRTVAVVEHPLTRTDRQRVVKHFARDRIAVTAAVDELRTVHIWAAQRFPWWRFTSPVPVTTEQEVRVLRAFAAVTDSRLAWHPAVTR